MAGPDGRRRQIRSRGHSTRKAAETALAESLWESSRQGAPPPSYTVAQYVTARIAERAHTLAPATRDRYERTVENWVKPTSLGTTPLAACDAAAAGRWVQELLERGLAVETIRTAARVLRVHLAGVCHFAPQMPYTTRPTLRVWSKEETVAALHALRGDLLYPLAAVAVTTGLRAGELLALRWDDLRGGALVVERSLEWIRAPRFKETKTGKARRVELYPETQAVLQAHHAAQDERQALLPGWETAGLVFPRPSGGPWKVQNLSSQWQHRVKALGLPRIHWHGLRHTHASHLLAAGVPVPAVAARLGHTVATLLKTYAHLIPGQQAEAVRLGSAFLGLRAQTCPEALENGTG